jgi:hypothetical protein
MKKHSKTLYHVVEYITSYGGKHKSGDREPLPDYIATDLKNRGIVVIITYGLDLQK